MVEQVEDHHHHNGIVDLRPLWMYKLYLGRCSCVQDLAEAGNSYSLVQ